MSWLIVYVVVAWAIRLMMVPVVLSRQWPTGSSLAWLSIIFFHPYIGLGAYLLVGESRLGRRRRVERRRARVLGITDPQRTRGDEASPAPATALSDACEVMARQAQRTGGMTPVDGNRVQFVGQTQSLSERLVADIDAAKSHVHLLYFIFAGDQTGRAVAAAVQRAAGRGVKCRVLVDALGSRAFLRRGLGKELSAAGVEVAAALPVAPFRRGLARIDFRNHRKLAAIDDRIAYAGSHNLINADYGGRRGGPWHDLSGRFTGPVVADLAQVFAEDWLVETGREIVAAFTPGDGANEDGAPATAQVVPTGPELRRETYRRVLLAAIQAARRDVTLTTPYFVPDEATLVALMMAADGGVAVNLVLPERSDNRLAAAAGRAHFAALLEAGVAIRLYQGGLLHAKTVTVDDAFGMLGSANLDVRSFALNFELSVLLYGAEVTRRLREVQGAYLARSRSLATEEWHRRSALVRYADRAVSLLSPLL
jgi:cardiolipin synthase